MVIHRDSVAKLINVGSTFMWKFMVLAESASVGAQRGLLSRKQKHLLDLLGALGPSIKDVEFFLSVFDTPLPNVGILILIYLTSTF